MGFLNLIKGDVCRGFNPPCGGGEITRAKWGAMRTPFTEGAVQGGFGNGGPVPPRLPDDLAEMPSDELMETWRRAAFANYQANAKPTWHTTALLAIAWARQQQLQSLQLSPPGADPVATDEELLMVARSPVWFDEARRAVYNRGRADERAAIAKALGVKP